MNRKVVQRPRKFIKSGLQSHNLSSFLLRYLNIIEEFWDIIELQLFAHHHTDSFKVKTIAFEIMVIFS